MTDPKQPDWLVVRGETSEQEVLTRLNWLASIRELAVAEPKHKWIEAAKKLAEGLGETVEFRGDAAAERYIREFFFQLLEADDYLSAAALAWRRSMFDPRPRHTRRIFAALRDFDLVLLVGAAGLGKSYDAAAWMSLNYARDPGDTAVKFASVQQTNLQGNLWATLRELQTQMLFSPVSLDDVDDIKKSYRIQNSRPDCGFDAIFLGRAHEAQGKLKGYHPRPFRPKPHPLFGDLTRINILLDELQSLPEGVKDDLNSPRASVSARRCMKIAGTANPTDASKWGLRLAEPPGGWTKEAMEQMWEWDTAEGWHVCRVDASKCENVIEGRIVYECLPDPNVQAQYLVNGIPTAGWYIFYKGWCPPGMSAQVVVPGDWFDRAIGDPIFTGPTIPFAGVDPSFVTDPPYMAVGRYGTASGWIDKDGVTHNFESRKTPDGRESRQCIVCDDEIPLASTDGTSLAKEVMGWCNQLQIPAKNVVVDMTGNGYHVFTELSRLMGETVIGVNWKNSPTERKILAEDKHPAKFQVVNIRSEMYWTARCWIQPRVHGLFINPVCKRRAELRHQLTTTNYDTEGGRQKIEEKEHWKSRNNHSSPNEADALVQMAHGPRELGLKLPALSDEDVATTQAAAKPGAAGSFGYNPDGPQTQSDTCESNDSLGSGGWERPGLASGDEVRGFFDH
jgi:hypothetical protein